MLINNIHLFFQAVQGIVNDKADAETVMNGWMMKLGKKENQF